LIGHICHLNPIRPDLFRGSLGFSLNGKAAKKPEELKEGIERFLGNTWIEKNEDGGFINTEMLMTCQLTVEILI